VRATTAPPTEASEREHRPEEEGEHHGRGTGKRTTTAAFGGETNHRDVDEETLALGLEYDLDAMLPRLEPNTFLLDLDLPAGQEMQSVGRPTVDLDLDVPTTRDLEEVAIRLDHRDGTFVLMGEPLFAGRDLA